MYICVTHDVTGDATNDVNGPIGYALPIPTHTHTDTCRYGSIHISLYAKMKLIH